MVGVSPYSGKKFYAISEKWIDENMQSFPDNSVMFCTACQSLKGSPSLYTEALRNKNLGAYLGFDDGVNRSFAINKSMDMFSSLMVMGCTAKGAYQLMDNNYTICPTLPNAHLQYLQKEENDDFYVSMCDAVDLGLSVLWGTRNLGAISPFKYGNFYQWGDNEVFQSGQKYKFWENDWKMGTKYIGDEISGNPLYDPATALLGEPWRMPTKAECEELVNNCIALEVKSKEWIDTDDWVSTTPKGMLFASKSLAAKQNNAVIFLPYFWNSEGCYWTGTFVPKEERTLLFSDIPQYEAYCLEIFEPIETGTVGKTRVTPLQRVWASNIRPVYDPN